MWLYNKLSSFEVHWMWWRSVCFLFDLNFYQQKFFLFLAAWIKPTLLNRDQIWHRVCFMCRLQCGGCSFCAGSGVTVVTNDTFPDSWCIDGLEIHCKVMHVKIAPCGWAAFSFPCVGELNNKVVVSSFQSRTSSMGVRMICIWQFK